MPAYNSRVSSDRWLNFDSPTLMFKFYFLFLFEDSDLTVAEFAFKSASCCKLEPSCLSFICLFLFEHSCLAVVEFAYETVHFVSFLKPINRYGLPMHQGA